MAAKRILEQELRLQAPPCVVQAELFEDGFRLSDRRYVEEAREVRFVRVELERRLGRMVPDMVGYTTTGERLLIKVAVTHFIDQEKRAKVSQVGAAMLEIDLSKVDRAFEWEALREQLCDTPHNWRWVHHPREAEARSALVEQLRKRLEAEKERRRAEERRRQAAERRRQRAIADIFRRARVRRQLVAKEREQRLEIERLLKGEGMVRNRRPLTVDGRPVTVREEGWICLDCRAPVQDDRVGCPNCGGRYVIRPLSNKDR